MSEDDSISDEELQERVIYATLGPAVRLARVFRVPLSDLKHWLDMAYYHETKRQNLKMKEVAALMSVSMSKVALLSRQLKENFIREDLVAELPRRIEFMLWAQPLSLAKLNQVLTDATEEEVEAAIQELLDDGRIELAGTETLPQYQLSISVDRRTWDSWLARIDGLNNVLRNVGDAVFSRFFADNKNTSFARTLTFRVRDEDYAKLQEFYETQLFELIQELDKAADDDEGAQPVSLSLFWAPHDLLNQIKSVLEGE